MTTGSLPAAGDPRRLLSDVRSLARGVRLDQRLTWVALAVLAVVTFVGIPFDWFGMQLHCAADTSCQFWRRGVVFYWPPALLLAYSAIAIGYVRAARARGLGSRVMPYVITGAATTVVFTAAWVAARLYFPSHPHQLSYWGLVLDRLVSPWATIGVALLVLARLERNLALLLYTVGYLAMVVLVLPMDSGWDPLHWGTRGAFALAQVICGVLLALGALGFVAARRWQR
jgi:hypothetical protein